MDTKRVKYAQHGTQIFLFFGLLDPLLFKLSIHNQNELKKKEKSDFFE